MSFFTARGRLPTLGEFSSEREILAELGSYKRAFSIVRRVTGTEQWDTIVAERKKDALVFLALAMFPRCPELSELPTALRHDVKAFWGSYAKAKEDARSLLFSVGKTDLVDSSCQRAAFGKLLPDALYVHASSINALSPELRVYEGCARVLTGRIEGATIIKLSRREPKVTYLLYPDFDRDPHPALAASLRVQLQTLKLKYHEFRSTDNPPILHRKETFVPADYPDREKIRAPHRTRRGRRFVRLSPDDRAAVAMAGTSHGEWNPARGSRTYQGRESLRCFAFVDT